VEGEVEGEVEGRAGRGGGRGGGTRDEVVVLVFVILVHIVCRVWVHLLFLLLRSGRERRGEDDFYKKEWSEAEEREGDGGGSRSVFSSLQSPFSLLSLSEVEYPISYKEKENL